MYQTRKPEEGGVQPVVVPLPLVLRPRSSPKDSSYWITRKKPETDKPKPKFERVLVANHDSERGWQSGRALRKFDRTNNSGTIWKTIVGNLARVGVPAISSRDNTTPILDRDGNIVEEKEADERFSEKGGFLADAMGLGKTVEALARFVVNRWLTVAWLDVEVS
ncbi:hypothetical protein H2201_008213 [Coniosporium apollinis]|uniref:SNF2 N-terminal domain-containing protein n=1 Tax=Coniosporium apollinis TaxID=61459 RepID=A0ABQ9NM19_9PEZI|nr:hypothetical protein H2201_008213 [Coniosporium apollinis]